MSLTSKRPNSAREPALGTGDGAGGAAPAEPDAKSLSPQERVKAAAQALDALLDRYGVRIVIEQVMTVDHKGRPRYRYTTALTSR